MQLIRVAEHLGASSRRPRHPFPALMAGEPLAVYLCTRPKKGLKATAEKSAVFCTSGPHDRNGHVTVQIHLPLLTATLVLQREPGIVAVVWANIVIMTLMVMSPYRYTSHCSLRHLSFNLNREKL